MSISGPAFVPRDLEWTFYGNQLLTRTERVVGVLILKCWDGDFCPVDSELASQSLLGHWAGAWRSTVNRAVRKLAALGYFRTTWKTVRRQTKQGWKGVTRVFVTPGPLLEQIIRERRPDLAAGTGVSPAKPRGVSGAHPTRTRPGQTLTVGSSALAKSTDRRGERPVDTAEFRRKTLAQWPRLAGSKPIDPDRLPSSRRPGEIPAPTGGELPGYTELSDAETEQRRRDSRRRIHDRLSAELAELDARMQRKQPRRRPPRSQR